MYNDRDFMHVQNSITPVNSQETLKLIKMRINDLSNEQLEKLVRYCKRKIYLNNMENRCFKQWKKGETTPIDDKTLKEWEHKLEFKEIKEQQEEEKENRMFYWCFHKWRKKQVSPIDNKYQSKFEYAEFRQWVLKWYGVKGNNQGYTVHHLFPKSIFSSKRFDIENVILISSSVHVSIHDNYTNIELLIDPIMPVIESLEAAFMENDKVNSNKRKESETPKVDAWLKEVAPLFEPKKVE